MDTLSLESMMESLFTGTKTHFGLESEDLTDVETGEADPEITDVVEGDEYESEGTVDAVEEAPAQEEGAAEPDGDEEPAGEEVPAGDSPLAATESMRLMGEANLMAMALRTAEQYQWSTEAEASEEGKDNVFKKFWTWLKKVFEKVRLAVVTFYRRITVWIAGDMKKYGTWYKANSKDIKLGGKAADVKLTVKLPENWAAYTKNFESKKKVALAHAKDLTSAISGGFMAGSVSGVGEKIAKTKSIYDELTVAKMSEVLYGKEGKAKEVTVAQFDKVFPLSKLADATGVKADMASVNEAVKAASAGIKAAQQAATKATDKLDAEAKKNLKGAGTSAQQVLNGVSNALIWKVSTEISLYGVALRFAQRVVKANKGEAAPAKGKDGKK